MNVGVRLAEPLRPHAGGAAEVALPLPEGATVADAIAALERRFPALLGRIRDEQGALRRHVNVFVGPSSVHELGGLAAPLAHEARVTILPAVSGGAHAGAAPGPGGTSVAASMPAPATAALTQNAAA